MIQTLKKIVKKCIYWGNKTTQVLDSQFLKKEIKCQWPPIFILGAPRSGTTLIYQLLISNFRFAYFPNIANTFYMCPIYVTQYGIKFSSGYNTQFESHYGFEKGLIAPSEAGNIWNRWFPQEKRDGFNYTPAGYLTQETRHLIYQIIANQERLFKAPFLTKNVKMNVRLPVIHEIFPNTLFIRIQRNPVNIALSLLLYRRKNNLDWHSVMPEEINMIKDLPDIEQVCHQIYFVEQNMQKDLQLFAPEQLHTLTYEELCENPIREIEKISNFLTVHECSLKRKDNKIPSTFHKSKPEVGQWISQSELEKIQEIISNWYSAVTS